MEQQPSNGGTQDVIEYPLPTLRGHIWKQYGNKLECQSCTTTHYAFLQPGQYISKYEDGIPVISQVAMPTDVPPVSGASESTS